MLGAPWVQDEKQRQRKRVPGSYRMRPWIVVRTVRHTGGCCDGENADTGQRCQAKVQGLAAKNCFEQKYAKDHFVCNFNAHYFCAWPWHNIPTHSFFKDIRKTIKTHRVPLLLAPSPPLSAVQIFSKQYYVDCIKEFGPGILLLWTSGSSVSHCTISSNVSCYTSKTYKRISLAQTFLQQIFTFTNYCNN